MKVKRYDLYIEVEDMCEEEEGDWVRWDDVEALLEKLRDKEVEIKRLNKCIDKAWKKYDEVSNELFDINLKRVKDNADL